MPKKEPTKNVVKTERDETRPIELDNMTKSGEQLIESYDVGDSPMKVVGNKEKGYFLVMGKWRISDAYESPDELLNSSEILSITFKMVATMIGDNEAEKQKVVDPESLNNTLGN